MAESYLTDLNRTRKHLEIKPPAALDKIGYLKSFLETQKSRL